MKANTLGELIEYLSERFNVSYAKLARIVVMTAKWQKEQMLKEAVEGEVVNNGSSGTTIDTKYGVLYLPPLVYAVGDEVKIVIVKEDKE